MSAPRNVLNLLEPLSIVCPKCAKQFDYQDYQHHQSQCESLCCYRLKADTKKPTSLLDFFKRPPVPTSKLIEFRELKLKCQIAKPAEVHAEAPVQEVLFNEQPTFWSKRQDTLMQYYGTASRRWASAQLLSICIDPVIQNT